MENRYKLLVLASTFPRYPQDTEPRFVYDLCLHLKDRFNITVLVPSFPGAKTCEEMEGITVRRFRYAPYHFETLAYPGAIVSRIHESPMRALLVPFFMLGMYLNLKKLLKNETFNFSHIHWLIPQGIIASCIPSKIMPPFLLTGHGGDIFSLNKGILKSLKQRTINRSSGITVVSQYLRDYLLDHYETDQNVNVIPMGCDLSRFSSNHFEPNYYKKNYGIDDLVILFVGRLAEKKGIPYLLDAMAIPLLYQRKVALVIAGDGPLKNSLIQQTRKLGLENKVWFIGNKSHDELPAIYANADIFCAPSITARDGDQESWGVVIIEAAASGLPVVTTRRGTDETVLDNKTGFVVEQKNSSKLAYALDQLVCSPELRLKFGAAATKHAQLYGWPSIAKQYADLYCSKLK